MDTLNEETLNMKVVDSACTKRVCRDTWLNCFFVVVVVFFANFNPN